MKAKSCSSSSFSPSSKTYSFFSFFLTQKVQTLTLPPRHPNMMYLSLIPIETISLSETLRALQHLSVLIFHTYTYPSTPPPNKYQPILAREHIDVLGKRPNIPLITYISFSLFSIFKIHMPSAQAVTCRFQEILILLTAGSSEGMGFPERSIPVLRSQQQAILLGVELSVANIYLCVNPTVEIVVDSSGNRTYSFVQRNSKSHKRSVPPINPTRQSLSITEKAVMYQGLVIICCLLLFSSSLTINRPATYTRHSIYLTIVKQSLVVAND